MKLCFDTSIFVSLVTNEAATPAVISWFSRQDAFNVVISDWVVTEFYSAIALKLRTEQISAALRAGAERLFEKYTEENFEIIPVERADFRRAAKLVANEDIKLRAGDALHLAIAERLGVQICTLDHRLFAAAGQAGISAYMP